MAVAFSARMTGGSNTNDNLVASGTTNSTTGMTVGVGDTLLLCHLTIQGASLLPTGVTVTWNSVSMSLGPSVTSGLVYTAIFALVSPASGAKTLAANWTNATAGCYMSAVSFTGTDIITGIVTADNQTSTGTSVTIPSSSTGATSACMLGQSGGGVTINQTQIWEDNGGTPGGGGSYAIGGNSNVHSFTGGGATNNVVVGVHIIPPSAATIYMLGHN